MSDRCELLGGCDDQIDALATELAEERALHQQTMAERNRLRAEADKWHQQWVNGHNRMDNLWDALRVIAGPADQYDPFMDAYREAGGGYTGLQAIAEAALKRAAGGAGTTGGGASLTGPAAHPSVEEDSDA